MDCLERIIHLRRRQHFLRTRAQRCMKAADAVHGLYKHVSYTDEYHLHIKIFLLHVDNRLLETMAAADGVAEAIEKYIEFSMKEEDMIHDFIE